jgi:hypothetical protein
MMLHLLLLAANSTIAGPAKPNLIVNGDFSAGNKGFITDYHYDSNVEADGYCCVSGDPHDCHPGGANMPDHTNGKGLMLVVNGSSTPQAAFWEQKVNVAPNRKFTFALWAATWSESTTFPDGSAGDVSPARIIVYINGTALNKPFSLSERDGRWTKLVAKWSSGDATTADIRVVDENLESFGNDFAVDDIVFHN